jgi:hypothetical protein
MQHVLYEGYLPTDVSGMDELNMIKKICAQKEQYGQKVRKEMRDTIQRCLNIWFYLETIGQQNACKEYIYLQQENERKAQEERIRQGRQTAAAIERQKRQQQAQNVWQQRQYRMQNRYYHYRW